MYDVCSFEDVGNISNSGNHKKCEMLQSITQRDVCTCLIIHHLELIIKFMSLAMKLISNDEMNIWSRALVQSPTNDLHSNRNTI